MAELEKKKALDEAGIILVQAGDKETIDLKLLLKKIGEMGIDSILVEGGGKIHGSFLEENLVNKVYAYIAPKLVGGATAKTPVGGRGFEKMKEAKSLRDVQVEQLGEDILVTGYL